MNKKQYRLMLQKSAKCDIILGTHNIAAEGLDIPDLNTLVFATPMVEIEQAVGRILRKFHKDINPMIIDMVDNFANFRKQGNSRDKYYESEDYTIDIQNFILGTPDYSKISKFLDNTEIKKPEKKMEQEQIDFKGKCMLDDDEPVKKTIKKSVKKSVKEPTEKCLIVKKTIKKSVKEPTGKCLL
jgi:superfamily II DNA or RNA helicase